MKGFKLSLIIMAAAILTLGLSGVSYAYHDGGVAYCEGCHSMHNSSGNAVMDGINNNTKAAPASYAGSKAQFQGNNYLLKGSDQSSTCLNCHAATDTKPNGYHVMTYPVPASGTGPMERTPGGDFAWIGKSFPVSGYAPASPGDRHGHNINAADYGLVADTTLLTAPGGTYSNANLSCISCHDPHSRARIVDATGTIAYSAFGKAVLPIAGSGSYGAMPTATEAVGVYRLLGGKNYAPFSYSGAPVFANDSPIAVAPSTYNRTESATDTRVAYGQGMSEWCSNCHTSIHNDNTGSSNTALIHPAGNGAKLTAAANDLAGGTTATIAMIYNEYKKSGDLTGTQATSYTSLVPYEEGTADRTVLTPHAVNNGSVTTGPSTGAENVMCLSCHRAHASGFNSMTRWNNNGEYLTVAGAWPDLATAGDSSKNSNGMAQAEYLAAMYDRPATNYATYQRSMCNKCHAKD